MLRRPLVLTKLALVLCMVLTIAAAPVGVAAAPAESQVVLAQEEEGGGGTETGPPWTYQMARITLVLVGFLGVGLGLLYYRLVVRRRRGDT
jgi:hypothetical protein